MKRTQSLDSGLDSTQVVTLCDGQYTLNTSASDAQYTLNTSGSEEQKTEEKMQVGEPKNSSSPLFHGNNVSKRNLLI